MSKEPLGTDSNSGDEPIRWVTAKEAEKFVSMVGRQYVRRFGNGDKIPKDQDPKEYIYKIIHVNPYTRYGKEGSAVDFLMQFHVQKCYRHKTRKVKTDPKTELMMDVNVEVQGHGQDAMGTSILLDSDAYKTVDAFDFEKQYMPDNT